MAKKFQFKLESLKKHRQRQEEEAQREFLAARAELDACLRLIDSFYKSIEDSRALILKEQKSGDFQSLERIRHHEFFIEGQKVRIERQRQVARDLMARVEDKQDKLIEAAREFKKIEKLKERQQAEYKKHLKQLETKRLDDLVVLRNGRKEIL